MSQTHILPESSQPWWQEKIMWLVVGGPAIVVVASFVTLYIAITTRDQIYVYDGPDSSAAMSEQTAPPPALETRNHLAIGGKKSRDKRSD